MENIQKEQINILNEMIKICNDGVWGYAKIAENIEDSDLNTVFYRLSQQRKIFAEELKNEVLSLGGEPEQGRSTEGYLHHQWLKIQSLLASGNSDVLLEACQTGEEYAIEVYSDHIADANLSSYLREKIIKQYEMIKGALNQIKSFKSELVS